MSDGNMAAILETRWQHLPKARRYNGGKCAILSAIHLLERRNFCHLKNCYTQGNSTAMLRDKLL